MKSYRLLLNLRLLSHQVNVSDQRLLRQPVREVGADELCTDLRAAGRGCGESPGLTGSHASTDLTL